jgi:fructose-1,6-bisphosphatase/inositol monophosphatase family enzyme
MIMPIDKVSALIREASEKEIMPRYKNLGDDEIIEKNKGDIVTAADLAVEALLTPQLRTLIPGSLVIGEEAVHADPDITDHLETEEYVWIIDPVDGTRSFARGGDSFCVIVALTRHGETLAGWIFQPTQNYFTVSEKGSGAFKDGERLTTSEATIESTRGALHTTYLPKHLRDQMKDGIKTMTSNIPVSSAGLEYVRVASGETDVTMFWNSYPWDHAAGALIVEEAGGKAGYKNGKRYCPGIKEHKGILVAGEPGVWQHWCDVLFNEEKWANWSKD